VCVKGSVCVIQNGMSAASGMHVRVDTNAK
jgi:hypothetical protein